MLPAAPLTLVECLIAADWCDEHEMPEYAERLRDVAIPPPDSPVQDCWEMGFSGWSKSRSGVRKRSASGCRGVWRWASGSVSECGYTRIGSEDWSRYQSG